MGAGSGAHICGIYFGQKTGTTFRYVPYRGGAPVMADLLANQVDFFCGEASQMLPRPRAGKMKPFVMMSKSRWSPMPEIPTMQEVGASDTHITFWNGLWAPKGTPRNVVARLNDAVVKAFADPLVIKRLTGSARKSRRASSSRRPRSALSQIRDRKMVAADQGSEHQNRVSRPGGCRFPDPPDD